MLRRNRGLLPDFHGAIKDRCASAAICLGLRKTSVPARRFNLSDFSFLRQRGVRFSLLRARPWHCGKTATVRRRCRPTWLRGSSQTELGTVPRSHVRSREVLICRLYPPAKSQISGQRCQLRFGEIRQGSREVSAPAFLWSLRSFALLRQSGVKFSMR